MIVITANGERRELERDMTITEFLDLRGLQARMVVVEHNREIIPRDRYSETTIRDGDELEVVQMMAGG